MTSSTNPAVAKEFFPLKITAKKLIAKNIFSLELEPQQPEVFFPFLAGQYLTLRFFGDGQHFEKDFSLTAAPFEKKVELGIKIKDNSSAAAVLYNHFNVGDTIFSSRPSGRFTVSSKPHEFRTIVGFAAGIGITPIFSHLKEILHREPRTRFFLFYVNKNMEETAYRAELDELARSTSGRFQVFYFLTREKVGNSLYEGRLDAKKVGLIINQILNLDDTDEESTIWDSVDEVLICGPGDMIRDIANASFDAGIPKKNIHFELFEEYNDDIYPQPKEFPLVQNIKTQFTINGAAYYTILPDNKERLLQNLLIQKFPVPYSCKSGICGSCICKLEEGEVELLENEYLTEREEQQNKILACMSVVLSKNIKVNFDTA